MVTFDIDRLKAACPYQNCKVQICVDGHELRIIWDWKGADGKLCNYGYSIRHSESHHSRSEAASEYLLGAFKRAMRDAKNDNNEETK